MKTIEGFYKEWENDKHYMGDEDSWAIWFAEDWEKYKQEQCNIADVVGRSEQLKAISDLKDFAYEVCPLHREDDLEEIIGRL